MTQFSYISLSTFFICTICTDAALRVTSGNIRDISTDVLPSSSFVDAPGAAPTCPEASSIAPCVCSVDAESRLYMDCSSITSNDELRNVYLNDFPNTEFYEFKLYDNNNITELGTYVFGNVTFERILIENTKIDSVSEYSLSMNRSRLRHMYINEGFLTENSFPFSSLDTFSNIHALLFYDQHHMTLVPPLTSSSLASICFSSCSIASIHPGKQVIYCIICATLIIDIH